MGREEGGMWSLKLKCVNATQALSTCMRVGPHYGCACGVTEKLPLSPRPLLPFVAVVETNKCYARNASEMHVHLHAVHFSPDRSGKPQTDRQTTTSATTTILCDIPMLYLPLPINIIIFMPSLVDAAICCGRWQHYPPRSVKWCTAARHQRCSSRSRDELYGETVGSFVCLWTTTRRRCFGCCTLCLCAVCVTHVMHNDGAQMWRTMCRIVSRARVLCMHVFAYVCTVIEHDSC